MSNENCFVVKWSIKNFSILWQGGGKRIFSPIFNPENMDGSKWRLKLFPSGGATVEMIGVQLFRLEVDDGPECFRVWYDLSLLSCDESSLKWDVFDRGSFSRAMKVKQNEVLIDKKDEYLSDDTLTVRCTMYSYNDSPSRVGRCFARTRIGTESLKFNGVLRRFSSLVPFQKQTIQLTSESPELHCVLLDIGLNDEGAIFITWNPNHPLSLRTYKLYIVDNTGKEVECTESDYCSPLKQFSLPFTKKDLICSEKLYLHNDSLTFQYEITFSPGKVSEEIEEPEYTEGYQANASDENEEPEYTEENQTNASDENDLGKNDEQPHLPTTFKDDMLSLYNSSVFHDIQLHVGAETVPAHKIILRARSQVFKEMLSTDVKEKDIEGIEITDLNLDTVKRMLLFLYTDTSGELELQSAKELYFASDKYGISSLKQRCSIFMNQNLQPSNVCEILVLADKHQDEELKSAVQEYILKNDGEVFSSDMWKSFIKSNSYLAAQVMYLKCRKS